MSCILLCSEGAYQLPPVHICLRTQVQNLDPLVFFHFLSRVSALASFLPQHDTVNPLFIIEIFDKDFSSACLQLAESSHSNSFVFVQQSG